MKDAKKLVIEAAALVPVYRCNEGELRLVLVRRSEWGVHGGHLAFPGGKYDTQDQSLLHTALREAWEETGLSCELIEVLAPLPALETSTTGFRIFPFLARIIRPSEWHRNRNEREIADIIEVRLSDLIRPEAHGEEIKHLPTWPAPRRIPFYRVGAYQVWGVTYRILHPLLPRLLAGEWDT